MHIPKEPIKLVLKKKKLTEHVYELGIDRHLSVIHNAFLGGVGWAKWTTIFPTHNNGVGTMQDGGLAIQAQSLLHLGKNIVLFGISSK